MFPELSFGSQPSQLERWEDSQQISILFHILKEKQRECDMLYICNIYSSKERGAALGWETETVKPQTDTEV